MAIKLGGRTFGFDKKTAGTLGGTLLGGAVMGPVGNVAGAALGQKAAGGTGSFQDTLASSVGMATASPQASGPGGYQMTKSDPGDDWYFQSKEFQGGLKPELTLGAPETINTSNVYADRIQRGDMLSALQNQALTPSAESPWLKLQLQKQAIEQGAAADESARQAAAGLGQAQSALAMRGGLRGGASERLARQGMRDQNLAAQGVRRQGLLDRLGLSTAAEDQRLKMLQYGTGVESDIAKADASNMLRGREAQAQMELERGRANVGFKQARDKANIDMLASAYDDVNRKAYEQWASRKRDYAADKLGQAISQGGGGSFMKDLLPFLKM